jgi:hypothetical protein
MNRAELYQAIECQSDTTPRRVAFNKRPDDSGTPDLMRVRDGPRCGSGKAGTYACD